MSDSVLIALIAGAPGVVASVLGFLNQVMIRQATTQAEKAAELGEKNEQHLHETKKALHATKEAMVSLEQHTNGIKDELVKTTAIASRALGNLEGRAELKRETDAGENSGK